MKRERIGFSLEAIIDMILKILILMVLKLLVDHKTFNLMLMKYIICRLKQDLGIINHLILLIFDIYIYYYNNFIFYCYCHKYLISRFHYYNIIKMNFSEALFGLIKY